MPIASVNPATGLTVRSFPAHAEAEVERRLHGAAVAAARWRAAPLATRTAVLSAAADLLDAERDAFAALMTLEMGKTLRSAVAEVEKCATGCRWYAEHAARIVNPRVGGDGVVRYDPMGVILAVMPWNFPFWQVIRFAAPAIAAGNVALLKHASNVPQCALALESLFARAGAPDGVFQTLLIGADRVARVIADPRVAAVTLTGSTPAGMDVASTAGAHVKKTVLELGGSDPFIVMPSADIAAAAKTGVAARIVNNGQSCIAAKRFIVHESVADDFEARFVEHMRALKVGDPLDPEIDVGPLATTSILNDLEEQVEETIRLGARLVLGGRRLAGPGHYYAPTVLADIPVDSPAHRDELFGPVASIFRVRGIDEAIRVANDTMYGLGSSVWTTDRAEAERFAAEIDAGSVFINAMVASDPRFPFGGVKQSGYGRELSDYGLLEFVNIKTVRGMLE